MGERERLRSQLRANVSQDGFADAFDAIAGPLSTQAAETAVVDPPKPRSRRQPAAPTTGQLTGKPGGIPDPTPATRPDPAPPADEPRPQNGGGEELGPVERAADRSRKPNTRFVTVSVKADPEKWHCFRRFCVTHEIQVQHLFDELLTGFLRAQGLGGTAPDAEAGPIGEE